MCLSKLCYGTDLCEIRESVSSYLEKFHENMSKVVQMLPIQSANPGSLKTIGWNSIECQIDIMRLLFSWRLLLSPMNSIYKAITIGRFLSCYESPYISPINILYETCKRYS